MRRLSVDTPLGPVILCDGNGAIVALDWGSEAHCDTTPALTAARTWLERYFAGAPDAPDLPLDPPGTPHQRAVWGAMRAIPRGTVQTYGEVAAAISSSPRAVGGACGANPIPIIIPCHRITAAGGAIGGYSGAGGTATKRFLLRLEGAPGL